MPAPKAGALPIWRRPSWQASRILAETPRFHNDSRRRGATRDARLRDFPGGRADEVRHGAPGPTDYFSIFSLSPSAATLMLAPLVSLLTLMTTPFAFRNEETPAPLPTVPSAPAAA